MRLIYSGALCCSTVYVKKTFSVASIKCVLPTKEIKRYKFPNCREAEALAACIASGS